MKIPYLFSLLRTILLISAFQIFSPHVHYSQSTYKLSANKDIPLIAVGLIGAGVGFTLKIQDDPLSINALQQLNSSSINALDQSALDNYSPAFRTASDVGLYTAYAFPLTTLLLPEVRSDWLTIAVMAGEMMMLTETLTGLTKTLVGRARPYTYNPDLPLDFRTQKGNNHAFFSGHTSYAASFSFFSAKVINDHLHNQTLKTLVWTTAAIWPAATGYFRYRAGQHFPTDVITGYAVGAAVGFLVPHLHKISTKQKKEPSVLQLSQLQVGPNSIRAVIML